MRQLAEFILRGRKQAILLALLFTIVPFFGWVSDVIMALVTLRKGGKEGGLVLLWIALPAVVLALAGYPQLWLYSVLGGSLATYLLALTLRHTSWAMVLQVGMVFCLVGVIVVHIWEPKIAEQWVTGFATYLTEFKKQFDISVDPNATQHLAQRLAYVATGMQAVLLLVMDLFNVFFARWWQSLLYNPGGLAAELKNIRLGIFPIAVLALVILGSIGGNAVAIDCIPVVALPFILAGLSLVHSLTTFAKIPVYWLIVFYVMLLVFFPYLSVALVIVVLADSYLDFRHRLAAK